MKRRGRKRAKTRITQAENPQRATVQRAFAQYSSRLYDAAITFVPYIDLGHVDRWEVRSQGDVGRFLVATELLVKSAIACFCPSLLFPKLPREWHLVADYSIELDVDGSKSLELKLESLETLQFAEAWSLLVLARSDLRPDLDTLMKSAGQIRNAAVHAVLDQPADVHWASFLFASLLQKLDGIQSFRKTQRTSKEAFGRNYSAAQHAKRYVDHFKKTAKGVLFRKLADAKARARSSRNPVSIPARNPYIEPTIRCPVCSNEAIVRGVWRITYSAGFPSPWFWASNLACPRCGLMLNANEAYLFGAPWIDESKFLKRPIAPGYRLIFGDDMSSLHTKIIQSIGDKTNETTGDVLSVPTELVHDG